MSRARKERWLFVGLFVPLLVLYAATLCPTVYAGDSADIVTGGAAFGIPHPPGYPLFMLVSNVWVRLLPFGEVAWRQNLLSAVSASAAAALLGLSLFRLGLGALGAAMAALTLGLGVTAWSQAVISEVYAFDLLLSAAAFFLATRARTLRSLGSLALFLVLLSLWVGHRSVNVLYAPALLFWAWPAVVENWRKPRCFPWLLLAAAGPLLVFFYLPVASSFDPPLNSGEPRTWERFWALVSAKIYRIYLFNGDWRSNLAYLANGVLRELGFGLLFAPIGLFLHAKEERPLAWVFAYLVAANLFFASNYNVPDVTVFTLPSLFALSALSGLGAARLEARFPRAWVAVGVGLSAVLLFTLNFRENNLRGQTLVEDFALDLLGFAKERALVLSHLDTATYSLFFAQAVKGFRPDLLVVSKGRAVDWHQEQSRRRRPDLAVPFYNGPDSASHWPAMLALANAGQAPVYVTANAAGYFAPPDASEVLAALEEVPAGLMMELVPKGSAPEASKVVAENREFWHRAWPHVEKARGQVLDTEMIAVLLHYATLRLFFAQYALAKGENEEGLWSSAAVAALDTGPLIAKVNVAYARNGARFFFSELPQVAEAIRRQAEQAVHGKSLPPETASALGTVSPPEAPSPRPGGLSAAGAAALNEEGVAFAKGGRMAEALAKFEEALKVEPGNLDASFNRAKALGALGKKLEAKAAFEALLARAPDNGLVMVHLAEYYVPEELPRAIVLYERALQGPVPPTVAQEIDRRLSELRGLTPVQPSLSR